MPPKSVMKEIVDLGELEMWYSECTRESDKCRFYKPVIGILT